MADTDDPWADHVRGTPLAEGSDPLSSMAGSLSIGGKANSRRDTDASADPPETPRSTPSMHAFDERSAGRNGTDEGEDTLRGDEFVYPGSTVDGATARSPIANGTQDEQEDDEDAFLYPGASSQRTQSDDAVVQADGLGPGLPARAQAQVPNVEAMEEPVASGSTASATLPGPSIDHARLSQLCSSGPVEALKSFFEVTAAPPPVGSGCSAFALANEPHPASGLAPIHVAAKEGRVDILKFLVREAGALIELEDREGETAVHKAALAGKLPALTFLLTSGASASSRDGDGWTPLHNACSKGYLDIVKLLIENARAPTEEKGGRGAWTPLMSAASKGHLPIVRYLTMKQRVDPFIRNAAGETAYDVAAATFEIFICEVLEKYESERWATLRLAEADSSSDDAAEGSQRRGPYTPLALHSIVPVILHENQRLDTRLSTLAMRGGTPRWSGTQAGRTDKSEKRAPGTMPPGPLSLSRTRHIPMARDDVRLPSRIAPYRLKLPTRSEQVAAVRRARGEGSSSHDELGSTPTPESLIRSRSSTGTSSHEPIAIDEPSHFWLSEWQTDYTHPQVDAEEGWQYSSSFDTPEERWVAATPPPLKRMLEGTGIGQSVQRAVTSVALGNNGNAPTVEPEVASSGWVRRRRWVRVLRRRLDVTFGDELEALEQASLDSANSISGANAAALALIEEAQQEAQEALEHISESEDYLGRASALAGHLGGHEESRHLIQKHIIRLEMAISELRQHAFCDASAERQQDAEELLKTYTLRIGQFRQQLGVDEESDEEEEDEDVEFVYPNSYKDDGQSFVTRLDGPSAGPSRLTVRPAVPHRHSSAISVTSERSGAGVVSGTGTVRRSDLANAHDFRVPTQDFPVRPAPVATSYGPHGLVEQSLLRTWENDADAANCRSCGRRFTFFVRKHHCRRCGKIFCDACSTHRAQLAADELIIDPGVPEMLLLESGNPSRICDGCDVERRLPSSAQRAGTGSMTAALGQLENASGPRPRLSGSSSDLDDGMSDVSSRASELNECPVCGRSLAGVGDDAETQEEHVRQCLDNGGAGGSVQGGRYLVYKLSEGPIVGKECEICLEELLVGMTIARLPCLCYYHRHCIDSWFSRGRTCPVHARAW